MKVFSPRITITFTNFTNGFSEEGIASTHLPLRMAPGIAWPIYRGTEGEGSDHLHQLYKCLLRGLFSTLYLCTDGFWNNPSARVERAKDLITFTNFTDVFLEAGKDCFSLFISEDGSQNNVTLLQRCLGRRIRSPPLTLQMVFSEEGKGSLLLAYLRRWLLE